MQVLLTDNKRKNESETCEICGTVCGIYKHGYYPRNKIDAEGKKSKEAISRRRCRKDNKNGKTFSYLPADLIPYHQYSLDFLWMIINTFIHSVQTKMKDRLNEVIDANKNVEHPVVDFYLSHIYSFINVFETARQRLSSCTKQTYAHLQSFMTYCHSFQYECEQGIVALNRYFFDTHGRYLFGTASQHRRCSQS